MLERLTLSELALVERAEVEFGPGLNVISGETGAGKSLLVESMSLLVGERAPADVVREGARAAWVEGEFRLAGDSARRVAELLSEWGLEFDGETLIVRREVQAQGRSRATVNQSPVTQAALSRLGDVLADLHGQHEHQSLLRPNAALETLDRLSGLSEARARYAEALAALREAGSDLERLEQSLLTLADRRGWMAEALREIDAANLREGEEETLRRETARLAHTDRLRELVSQALQRLSETPGAALEGLHSAAHAVEGAAALDPSLAEIGPMLDEARLAAGEAARSLAEYASGLESDPEVLETLEARRELIGRLTRKHRKSVPELLRWRDELESELGAGENAEQSLERARERREQALARCLAAGRSLSRSRQAGAKKWSDVLSGQLGPLGMKRARLEFAVRSRTGEEALLPHGLDEVELQFAPNPGEPPRPLQRIVSGGELSRVMLALKVTLEARDRVDVLIFDEVDSGVGGAVAQAVGERLWQLAQHRQIVCVTHLPMIAALAQQHFRVSKQVEGGRTRVRVEPLEPAARIDELARMLAGDRVTDTTRRQARELLAPPARQGSR